jgi:hypothetical protein
VIRVSIFLIAVALIAGMVGYVARHPIEIHDWYDLNAVRDNQEGSYLLMNNLGSTTPGYEELASPTANQGKGWEPIGASIDQGVDHGVVGFMGTFDGQGYEIRDLFINRPDESYVGLFLGVGQEGVIKDIGVVNATVTGNVGVGALAGWHRGTVSNSYSTGNATGNSLVGGLVGLTDIGSTVSNSYSTGSATGNEIVGGLVGGNMGTVLNSYSTGSVSGNYTVGGLVGLDSSDMLSSYRGTVTNSFWDIQTSGQATSDGGEGKTTAEMRNIIPFSGAGWNIIAVADPSTHNSSYIWNVVDGETYPFLSWESVA